MKALNSKIFSPFRHQASESEAIKVHMVVLAAVQLVSLSLRSSLVFSAAESSLYPQNISASEARVA